MENLFILVSIVASLRGVHLRNQQVSLPCTCVGPCACVGSHRLPQTIQAHHVLPPFTRLSLENSTSNDSARVEELTRLLKLEPHPEGGKFRQTYQSKLLSVIYFLIPRDSFSAWHKLIDVDEVWNFHDGCPLALHLIYNNGTYVRHELGVTEFSAEVPANTWMAAEPIAGCYSLIGTVVAPPFTYDKFVLPPASELSAMFPQHTAIIKRLTRS